MNEETMNEFTPVLGSPMLHAAPRSRIRRFKIVREVPVLALVKKLRTSARKLQAAMSRWCDQNPNIRGKGNLLHWHGGCTEKRILTDEKVVACWDALCSQMTHLKIRDYGGMPVTACCDGIGGEAHIDISWEDITCDGSAEALVERMMLNHASNQLWLFWHACYSEERLYLSKNEYVERMGNQMGPFEHEPKDSDFAIRAGYADCGEPVFEFVADTECGEDAGVRRWRALRDDGNAFGVVRGVIREFPLQNQVITML